MGDHLALPVDDGDPPGHPRLEAMVTLTHLAAVTSAIRLGFGVIVLPQRQPVLLAKQMSPIDALGKGRLTVGIGVGYVELELTALARRLLTGVLGLMSTWRRWECCGTSRFPRSWASSSRSPT